MRTGTLLLIDEVQLVGEVETAAKEEIVGSSFIGGHSISEVNNVSARIAMAFDGLFHHPTPTTVELLQEVHGRVRDLRGNATLDPALDQDRKNAAGREFSLAITAVEDAIMRFNRAQAELRGTRRDFDFELPA